MLLCVHVSLWQASDANWKSGDEPRHLSSGDEGLLLLGGGIKIDMAWR